MKSKDDVIKRMVQLVQSGAVMLDATCPLCGSPLFKLKNGDIICPVHGKVKVVSSEEEVPRIEAENVIRLVIDFASDRIKNLIQTGSNPRELYEWLSILEKAINIENSLTSSRAIPHSESGRRTPREKEGS